MPTLVNAMKQIVSALAAVIVVGWLAALPSLAGDEVQDARLETGRRAYERYCTPCHGAGGVPGSAVFAATKKPVDLRTLVERNGGRFPTVRWWSAVLSPEPGAVHTQVGERIRKDQPDSVDPEITAHGLAVNIEDYLISIQQKK